MVNKKTDKRTTVKVNTARCAGESTQFPSAECFCLKTKAGGDSLQGSRLFCYRCLSHAHLQRSCPEKNSCVEKDCARPQDHHSMIHVPTINEAEDVEGSVDQSSSLVSNLFVNNATMEDVCRSFVLLKIVPLRVIADNGNSLTTYGLLDSAAVGSMITSNRMRRLQLQGVPEKVSKNTVNQRNQNLELSKVKFQISCQWQLGRIIRVLPGRDGLVHTVEVKTRSSKPLLRSRQRLCLLKGAGNLDRD